MNCFWTGLLLALLFVPVFGQMADSERKRNREILLSIQEQVVKSYFDKDFRGVDFESKFRVADEKVRTAPNNSEAFFAIADFLASLNDSHTRFVPPPRQDSYNHGWLPQMVGEKCLVVGVMKGSNAEKQGLRAGDRIVEIEGVYPTRAEFDRIIYILYALDPRPDFTLVVENPAGERRTIRVEAKQSKGQVVLNLDDYNTYMNLLRQSQNLARMMAHRVVEVGDVTIWKMPRFDLAIHQVDDLISKVKNKSSLILDLRGNGGGNEDTLLRLLGRVFDEDVKIGELIRRTETKPLSAKSVGDGAFMGKLVVLIDSESGSASEVFARVVQLRKRGTVIGDRSSGKVMRSIYYPKKIGFDRLIVYGVNVTDADLIMADGSRIERNGVIPDKLMLPTPMDLRENHDPVLAHALSLVGAEITPQKAGTLFPFIWK